MTTHAARHSTAPANDTETGTDDKDFPLREDIRLLGRLLGDTVREQEGDGVYGVIESVRQASVRFNRDDDDSAPARWPRS
ncbi:phosphoenolpyruvate carboxylase [Azospirillum brasilense]|uniref:phosphoenolpyruvate carboxylase n=1 Tax=Azospirillum brasilense TaxID=192 RepID=UPI0003A7B873|nr:phosphoenolpyruvate carboxylase [Azospirillum brasilense]